VRVEHSLQKRFGYCAIVRDKQIVVRETRKDCQGPSTSTGLRDCRQQHLALESTVKYVAEEVGEHGALGEAAALRIGAIAEGQEVLRDVRSNCAPELGQRTRGARPLLGNEYCERVCHACSMRVILGCCADCARDGAGNVPRRRMHRRWHGQNAVAQSSARARVDMQFWGAACPRTGASPRQRALCCLTVAPHAQSCISTLEDARRSVQVDMEAGVSESGSNYV
jgi:hypothetical protein